ncbi:ketopantoate reductase family protein [Haloimpatiens sp. FM7330]|uniref:ketopantoate reductase family protein n=1 Tax=Haloimpatiens sp. FM7330 TaxID=3298610 RepID=UPI003640860E
MKILIIGTGVIGSVYGWQLFESGNDVTHFVRKGKKQMIEKQGIHIRCLDMRVGEKNHKEVLYKPKIVEDIYEDANYDLIIVPVKANQLSSILPIISKTNNNSDILILQNIWIENIKEIESYLIESKVFFGQPHIMGGGKDEDSIYCTIFGSKDAPTMLGQKDGKITHRLLKVAEVMNQAKLNPKVSKNMLTWLYTHYAESVGLLAGVMKAGSGEKYVKQDDFIKLSILIVREGYKVCRAVGIPIWKAFPQVLYYLPISLLLPQLKKMFSSKETQLMIKGHISHSPDEMKEMFYKVLNMGEKLNISMPNYRNVKKYIDEFTVN